MCKKLVYLTIFIFAAFIPTAYSFNQTTSSNSSQITSNFNSWQNFNKLLSSIDINYNDPIIELSNSEQNLSEILASMGAKKVYSLSTPKHAKLFPKDNASKSIYIIKDDFSKSKTVNNLLKDKQVGLIIGTNVLQNWSARKIETELKRMNKGLKKGGKVLFNISNPFITNSLTENFFNNEYFKRNNLLSNETIASDRARLNTAVNHLARIIKKEFPEYNLLPTAYFYDMKQRLVLYPFEMSKKSENGVIATKEIKHLLFPENMKVLLKRAGFSDIKIGKISGENNSFVITGTKI